MWTHPWREWITGEQEGLGKSSIVVEPPLPRSSIPVGPIHRTPKGTPQGTPCMSLVPATEDVIKISDETMELKRARALPRLLELRKRLKRL